MAVVLVNWSVSFQISIDQHLSSSFCIWNRIPGVFLLDLVHVCKCVVGQFKRSSL